MGRDNTSNIIDLNQSLLQKETEIELLQQTFTEIGSELDLEKVFDIVSQRARSLIDAETLLIPLLDDDGDTYTYRGGAGKDSAEIIGQSLPLEFGVCGWVWKQKRPWWHGVTDELSDEEKNRWERQAGNLILVPLQGKRQFLGGIAGMNKTNGQHFDRKDLNLLQLFASIVSVAIENAMAVKTMEVTHAQNENYRLRLEILNKQLIDSTRELEYLSLYDSVTSLPNRSLFYDRLSRDIEVAESNGRPIGILLVDVDSFKDVNDSLGHDFGDELLDKIARRFEANISSKETLARLGGDEFVIVLPDHREDDIIKRAQSLLHCLSDPFSIEQHKIVINASIGVALYPEHGDTISTLLSHADFAMYEAKNSSAEVSIYNPENDHLSQGHLALVADIRAALEYRQFELHYQPKVSARDGVITSAEALGRWRSERHGEVSPKIFISLLEQNGLIDEYTYWAIETALLQAKQWRDEGHVIRVAVNLSPQTLMHPDFLKNIDDMIKDRSDGSLIMFEITENLFLSEFERLSDVLEHVCTLGVEFSIDDYGTGYSSLSRLRRLPVSELKIDQSFIRDMVDNKDDEAVVHSTIELAHNLGLSVVAEGVEQQSALDLLIKLGCDTIQGYLISKPLAVTQFNAFLKSN